jgi:transposase
MYIAITRKKYKNTYHEQILLRESYREDGKVKTRTIANLTNKPRYQVDAIAAVLKNKNEPIITTKNQVQGRSIAFSFVIIFIMKALGIFKSIGKTFEARVAIILIAARIVLQSSRIQALIWAKNEDKILDLLGFDEQDKETLNARTIYHGLDYMAENQEKIEDKLFKFHYKKNPPKRVFYDVTSSYVEGDYSNSELVTYGYNRDKKQGKAQIVIGLLTDENGHAISIHTYKGNTNDIKTFADQLDKLKNRFGLENITIVGDGGMIKSDDIIKIKDLGYDYITSIGKPSIQKLIDDQNSKVQMSLFDENLKDVIDDKTKTRYILRQNPIRKLEIRKTRESKIVRLKSFIELKTNYYNKHFRAKSETLIKNIDKKIASLKLAKFITYEIDYKSGDCGVIKPDGKTENKIKELATVKIVIDEEARKEVEELDGCYVVKTSLIDPKKESKEEIHKAYKTLIKVENAFKTLKTDFLEIRPLYLKMDKRIKGHVALSMIAYNIVLKLRNFISLSELDFKSTIRNLITVKTVQNNINIGISYETIPAVCDDLKKLFNKMNLKLPNKI